MSINTDSQEAYAPIDTILQTLKKRFYAFSRGAPNGNAARYLLNHIEENILASFEEGLSPLGSAQLIKMQCDI